jgi:hypothetical protein
MEKNELLHWGIKGQKWGIRRFQNKDGSLTPAGKKKYGDKSDESPDGKTKSSETKAKASDGKFARPHKSTKQMSEEELIKAINRLNLEKQYKQALKDVQPEAVSRGKKTVADILESSAKNIGTQTLTYVSATLINKVLASYFNDDQVINPKKGQKKD